MSKFSPKITIAILALQGNFIQHRDLLHSLSDYKITAVLIRSLHDLRNLENTTTIDGLILPGGESTTMAKLLKLQALLAPLKLLISNGLPVLSTCAGTILLANSIMPYHVQNRESTPPITAENNKSPNIIALADIVIARNAYGRQLHSFTAISTLSPHISLKRASIPNAIEGLYIRAPKIVSYGANVEVLSSLQSDPVVVQENHKIMTTFHPEALGNTVLHKYFLEHILMSYK